ncbi:MAG TPA: hypothetical protein VN813_02175 [Luteibacter sp.]|jgi:hypothetical protein|nr:hypothetical protein [Luteibacter sp.]
MKTEALAPAKLPPAPTIDELGRDQAKKLDPTRSVNDMPADLREMLRAVDLTNVRPSQLRGIVTKLFEQGRISEDAAGEFLLARRTGAKRLSDDGPINLVEEMRQALKRSGAIMQRYSFAETDRIYDEAYAAARGLNEVIAFLRKHPRLDVRA